MGRLLFLLGLLGLGWWCSTNGILYNLMHGFAPEPSRHCVLKGARKDGTCFVTSQEDIVYPIDAHVGAPGQKFESLLRLNAAISKGLVYLLPENTGAKVVSNSKYRMYTVQHPIVEVELVGGDLSGQRGWVERDNVIDSPFMEAVNAMRATGRKKIDSGSENL